MLNLALRFNATVVGSKSAKGEEEEEAADGEPDHHDDHEHHHEPEAEVEKPADAEDSKADEEV